MENRKKQKHGNKEHSNSNVVDNMTLKVLYNKHNALARYIGVPCVVVPSEVMDGAAMADGSIARSNEYMSYRIDLRPFKGHFRKIRFRAASNGADIVFGFVKDKSGKIECAAGSDTTDSRNIILPLSEESASLIATIPANNGNPLWKNISAELLCDGLISEVNDALNYLSGKLQELERKMDESCAFKQAEINLSIV